MQADGREWTRRRVLRWSLGLLPMVAGAGWAVSSWLDERERRQAENAWLTSVTRDASFYVFCGRLDEYSLRELMQRGRHHAPLQLLVACWFTHLGEWDLSLRSLASQELKDTPEASFLRALVQRRPQASQWHQVFIEVWRSQGMPDFRQSVLLPSAVRWNDVMADTVAAWDSPPATRRLSLVGLDPLLASSHPEDVRALIRDCPELPLLLALREDFHGFDPGEPLRLSWLPVIEERVSQLAGASPRTLQLALRSFLAGSPSTQSFTRVDLENLEALVSLSVWKQPPSEQTFLALREQLADLAAPGHHAALLTRHAQSASLGIWLLARARASQSVLNDEDRRWLGRLLWTVGARLREQHSLNEVETGLRLQLLGSEWTQHGPSRDDCIDWWGTLGRWQDDLARSGFARWPLAALHEESAASRTRDELAWVRAFAEPAPALK